VTSIWDSLAAPGGTVPGALLSVGTAVALNDLAAASALSAPLEALRGRSVLVASHDQLPAALALIELDGIARRLVIAPPDVPLHHLEQVAKTAGIEIVIADGERAAASLAPVLVRIGAPRPAAVDRRGRGSTEWILLTSGTTGVPKLVLHTLDTLAGALPRAPALPDATVWSTFYDIRRYGGMQIFLRAVLGGAPLVLSQAEEPARDFLARAGAANITHISGTPSHWRKALMSGAAHSIVPRYVRLSGEIADQAVLDGLIAAYPNATVAHAFASTEAGVGFDVTDGFAGFPATLLQTGPTQLKVEHGTLRVRSPRNAIRYLGTADPLVGEDGFVDTDDMVELRGGRYYFTGRRGGIINVGGQKVHPEEVEAVINSDPRVRMSLVRARRNPITGAVVVADVVLADAAGGGERLKAELIDACRRTLPSHKVPAMLRFVPSLELTPAGKLVRPGA